MAPSSEVEIAGPAGHNRASAFGNARVLSSWIETIQDVNKPLVICIGGRFTFQIDPI